MVRHTLKILQQRVKRQPHEMVEHTQTIVSNLPNDLGMKMSIN